MSSWSVLSPLTDHCPTLVNFNLGKSVSGIASCKFCGYCLSEADIPGLQESLAGVDWSPILQAANVSVAADRWSNTVRDQFQQFVPIRLKVFRSPSLSHGIPPFWLDLRVAAIVFSGVRAGNLLLTHLLLRIATFGICMWLRFAEPSVTTIARRTRLSQSSLSKIALTSGGPRQNLPAAGRYFHPFLH